MFFATRNDRRGGGRRPARAHREGTACSSASQRAGGVPLGAAAVPRGEVAADRGAPADGDRGGLGARGLARPQRAARPVRGVHIPEAYGGQGFGFVELGIVLEEMGRALLCAPYFASTVLAATAIMNAGTEAQKRALLPPIADGDTRRHAGLHRAERTLGCGRDRNDGDAGRGRLPARWRQELRPRRPHRRPDRRAGAPPGFGRRGRAVVLHGARRCARADAPRAEGDGPDPQAGAARIPRRRGGPAGRGRRRRAGRSRKTMTQAAVCLANEMVGGAETAARSRRWTMPTCACSSAAPSPRSSR